MMKKLVAILLMTVLVFSLVACGGSPSSAPSSSAVASSTPEPAEPELHQEFLTGLEQGPNYPDGMRITGVMVNNIAQSRPARGLSDAKILVEMRVEGGITRFMAIYDDYRTIPTVGPVRSARHQFFQLIQPFWGFFVHIGQSVVQAEFVRDWDYAEFDIDGNFHGEIVQWDSVRRSAGFAVEHTAYTSGDLLSEYIEENNLDDQRTYGSTIFSFVPYTEPRRVPTEGEAPEVAVIHSASYRSLFEYDEATHLYNMSQYNSSRGTVEASIDENNDEQLAFDNLLVLFTNIYTIPGHEAKDLQNVDYGGGPGYYFTEGHYEYVYWQKGGPQEPLRIYTGDRTETPVLLNPGTTYLSFVSNAEWDNFYTSVTQQTGREDVAAGQSNTNEASYDD